MPRNFVSFSSSFSILKYSDTVTMGILPFKSHTSCLNISISVGFLLSEVHYEVESVRDVLDNMKLG
jgi:hypothetical protein